MWTGIWLKTSDWLDVGPRCFQPDISSILTFLMQSEVGGLEMDFNGTWEEVPFRPNTFTVNLGNILEHATFGVVKGALSVIIF